MEYMKSAVSWMKICQAPHGMWRIWYVRIIFLFKIDKIDVFEYEIMILLRHLIAFFLLN